MPISHISASSSVFLSGDQGGLSGGIPRLSNKRRSLMRPQARTSSSDSLRYPALTEKPEWWWRTLASIPYLISIQISDTGFFVQPLLSHYDKFEDLIYYIPGGVKRWSMWFPMLYYYFTFIGVVKKKEWPHFFRYHVIMAMLLETALQVVWHTSNFMPLIHFNGTFGMYYWAAVAFIYVFISLECIRCALGGKYVKIPFISESALIHTLYHVGGFYRPF